MSKELKWWVLFAIAAFAFIVLIEMINVVQQGLQEGQELIQLAQQAAQAPANVVSAIWNAITGLFGDSSSEAGDAGAGAETDDEDGLQ
jgi:hypothetical protein